MEKGVEHEISLIPETKVEVSQCGDCPLFESDGTKFGRCCWLEERTHAKEFPKWCPLPMVILKR